MRLLLTFALLAACHASPRTTAAPAAAGRACAVAGAFDEDAHSFAVVVEGVRFPIDGEAWGELPLHVTPLASGGALVAISELPVLWRARCDAAPSFEPMLERASAEFASGVLSADGARYYFTDAHGLAALRLADGTIESVTTAPPPGADFVADCNEVEHMMNPHHGLTAANPIEYRDWLQGKPPEGDGLLFWRGAWCETGIGPEFQGEEWLIEHPGEAAKRVIRRPHPVASVSAGADGLWLADAGSCERVHPDTRGAVWHSADAGATWTQVPVIARGQVVAVDGVPEVTDVAMSEAADGVWADPDQPGVLLVHERACHDLSGDLRGGLLFASRDAGKTWRWLELPGASMYGPQRVTRVELDDPKRFTAFVAQEPRPMNDDDPDGAWADVWLAFSTDNGGATWAAPREDLRVQPASRHGYASSDDPIAAPRQAERAGQRFRASWDGLWRGGERVFPPVAK